MKKTFFKILMLVAFVGFAGMSALAVSNLQRSIDSNILATSSNIPKTWEDMPESSDARVNLETSASDTVIIYTVSIQNTRQDNSLYLTGIASYLDESHGDRKGFLPLSNTTAEFSYNPDNGTSSWSPLELSSPQNGTDGFRLAHALTLTPAGSDNDTLYIRYQVSPSLDQDVVSNKIVALLDDGSGYTARASTSTSVAVDIKESPYVVAADTENPNPHAIFDEIFGDKSGDNSTVATNNSENGDSAFANPLGAYSEVTALKTLTGVATASTNVDDSFVSTTGMILVGILAVFAIAVIGYIVVVKY